MSLFIDNTITNTSIFFNTNFDIDDFDLDEDLDIENKLKLLGYSNTKDYGDVTNYINNIITKSELCKGLNKDYLLRAFEDADAIVTISSSLIEIIPNGNVNIFGFALLNFDPQVIYIDVMCSHQKGIGNKLINIVEKIGKILLMKEIQLISVKSAIPFYEKCGFKRDDNSCEAMCLMTKKLIIDPIGGKIKKTRIIKKTRKTRKIRKTKKNKKNEKNMKKERKSAFKM